MLGYICVLVLLFEKLFVGIITELEGRSLFQKKFVFALYSGIFHVSGMKLVGPPDDGNLDCKSLHCMG